MIRPQSDAELLICKIINKNTKKANITPPIIGVVPQPGATFPYSAFKGRKISPNLVAIYIGNKVHSDGGICI